MAVTATASIPVCIALVGCTTVATVALLCFRRGHSMTLSVALLPVILLVATAAAGDVVLTHHHQSQLVLCAVRCNAI
jgi:hypothetical protein